MVWGAQAIKPKDYFQLAIHQFPQRGCPLADWEIDNTETLYKHGLIAASYINKTAKNVLISFQLIGTNEISQQALNYARDFAKNVKVKAQNLGFQLAYTGFEQGGSIAELCAIQDKLQAYTFDSKPIFDKSPHQNCYLNLNRYTSSSTPSILYGNVFYVDIYSGMEAELLERWNQALQRINKKNQIH